MKECGLAALSFRCCVRVFGEISVPPLCCTRPPSQGWEVDVCPDPTPPGTGGGCVSWPAEAPSRVGMPLLGRGSAAHLSSVWDLGHTLKTKARCVSIVPLKKWLSVFIQEPCSPSSDSISPPPKFLRGWNFNIHASGCLFFQVVLFCTDVVLLVKLRVGFFTTW